MKNSIKQTLGAAAMTALAIGTISMVKAAPIETGQLLIKDKPISVEKGKSDTIKPNPPSVEKGKSATIPLDPPTVESPATERGIRDNGVKSCSGCGMTGRVAAPPATGGPGDTPPSVDFGVDGQILDRGRFPRTSHFVAILSAAAATGGILAASSRRARPVSP